MPPAPDAAPDSTTTLTDLPEDLLGEIYSKCKDSSTKRNLRQACSWTYACPAINSQLRTFTIRYHSHMSNDDIRDAVRGYPKHAVLKELRFIPGFSPKPLPVLQHLSADEASRHKMRSVTALRGLVGGVNLMGLLL